MTFTESGSWFPAVGRVLRFRNVFRWSRAEAAGGLRLEHLRFGPDRPVHLFDLVPGQGGLWLSSTPHVCREDCYSAHLAVREGRIEMGWAVRGPSKDESITYFYFWR